VQHHLQTLRERGLQASPVDAASLNSNGMPFPERLMRRHAPMLRGTAPPVAAAAAVAAAIRAAATHSCSMDKAAAASLQLLEKAAAQAAAAVQQHAPHSSMEALRRQCRQQRHTSRQSRLPARSAMLANSQSTRALRHTDMRTV